MAAFRSNRFLGSPASPRSSGGTKEQGMRASSSGVPDRAIPAWRATAAGFAAILVGIGLARFAYTPLLPALIHAGWFAASPAAYLGAANLAGYLAGALLARRLAERFSAAPLLRWMMLLVVAAFVACGFPLSFLWYFVWRFAAGFAGGALMAFAAPTVLPLVTAAWRGLASGIIFAAVGLGIIASGTLVPLLLRLGLAETWLGLGAISLLLTALSWGGWPVETAAAGSVPRERPPRPGLLTMALLLEYGLIAVGLVPHMVFLVDFVARGLGRGIAIGAAYWVLFGVGAVVGPILAGAVADRVGFRRTLRLGFVAQAVAVALPALSGSTPALALSSVAIGAFVPGVSVLVLGRVNELMPPEGRRAAWGWATTAFAVGQAVAAYGFSFLFAEGAGYGALFLLGAVALLAGLLVDLGAAGWARRRR
jgi:predicted MFS family arabinose efflux permease